MLQCQNIFFARFVSSQIRDDWSQGVFFAQLTSCAMRYDVIYHSFPYYFSIFEDMGG